MSKSLLPAPASALTCRGTALFCVTSCSGCDRLCMPVCRPPELQLLQAVDQQQGSQQEPTVTSKARKAGPRRSDLRGTEQWQLLFRSACDKSLNVSVTVSLRLCCLSARNVMA